MKKIGLISYHRDPNYGTMLQAFALANAIGKMGYDCEYLNYYEYNRPSLIKIVLSNLHKFVKRALRLKGKDEYDFFNSPDFKKITNQFRSFHDSYIPHSKTKFYYNTINSAKTEYDFFIVGSDQTWSEAVNKVGTTINFLEFEENKNKKRSYAPSIGTIHISENYLETLTSKLKDFRNLSCRERPNCKLLESRLASKVEYVLDPTLLLCSSDWDKYIGKPIIKGSYILAYILGTRECISRFAEKLGEYYKLPVYFILTRPGYLCKDNLLSSIGPFDFINLIKNASFIVTDSFHGTIFSLNYGKNFYSFTKRLGNQEFLDNDRIGAILDEFDLGDRLLKDDSSDILDYIDYSRINPKLESLRESSWAYLKTIID